MVEQDSENKKEEKFEPDGDAEKCVVTDEVKGVAEKKKNQMTLTIDLDQLYDNVPKYECPENQRLWASQAEISQEYQKMVGTLSIIATFMARTCNEGPEVKDNVTKRLITVKTVLDTFLQNLSLTGYDIYGLLTESLHDAYMDISGRQKTVKLLREIQEKSSKLGAKKAKEYTS